VRACVSVSVHVLFAESVCRVYVCGGIMLLVSPLLDRVVAVVELFFFGVVQKVKGVLVLIRREKK